MSRAKGDIAEDRACEYIVAKGFMIIERNYTLRGGEIDIIAIKDEVIHFIEVKSGVGYDPICNITPKKLQYICNTAYRFMQRKQLDLPFQIDAISVQAQECKMTENITF